MMSDLLYAELNKLRDEYRGKMNRSAEAAQAAAQTEDMDIVSMCSTESERYREAFHAITRAIQIIENSNEGVLASQSAPCEETPMSEEAKTKELVANLRAQNSYHGNGPPFHVHDPICTEAADFIDSVSTQLSQALRELGEARTVLDGWRSRCAELEALLS